MSKLVMCQGLPGSGKSTWAADQVLRALPLLAPNQFVNEPYVPVVVNKDDIRLQLQEDCGWHWSREGEKLVVEIRDAKIQVALSAGKDVISSDTNFGGGHEARLRQLAAEARAEFEVKKFLVPVEECIRRDSLREHPVGEAVIRGMAAKNPEFNLSETVDFDGHPAVEFIERVDGLPNAILCDLDGTLCLNNGHRGPFDYAKADKDELCVPIRRLLEIYYRFMNYTIVYMSGREEYGREAANAFMRAHHCPPGELWMRENGDRRKDSIVKRELFDAHVRGKWNVEFVLDDRDQVVRMWRELGLKCFQVAEGNF